jgi:hypothetical protein
MSLRRERKVVTVLFADLAGFTTRAESMDPEDVAALLDPYHARLKSELERFGGTVEKFIGGAGMAIFGAPPAHRWSDAAASSTLVGAFERARQERAPQLVTVMGFSVAWVHVLSWTLTDVGPGLELATALKPLGVFPWIRAAITYAEGEPRKAADICGEISAVSEEAYARLAAVRLLTEEGRSTEADGQLRRALGFYRSVIAKHYVQEGEAPLAASA